MGIHFGHLKWLLDDFAKRFLGRIHKPAFVLAIFPLQSQAQR